MRASTALFFILNSFFSSMVYAVTCSSDGSTTTGSATGHFRQLLGTMNGTANCKIWYYDNETPTIRLTSDTGVNATGGVASIRSYVYLPGNTSIKLNNYTIDGNPEADSYGVPYQTTIGSSHVVKGDY
jgi:hypothetical protein